MTLSLKVPLKQAEKWKNYLANNNLINREYRPSKDDDFMYFPLLKKFNVNAAKNISFINKSFEKIIRTTNLKESLKGSLTKKELEFLQTAQDMIGTISILEIPDELIKREKIIAETLLKTNSHIKTVLKKAESHKGVFRTQKMTYLAGEKTKEAVYKENSVTMKLDVEKVYFSPRLSNERLRIANQAKLNENILVMFSGCAPFPLVISKNSQAKHILGIEINPAGHKYGLENIKLNKIKNIDLICGDVHKIIPQLKKKNSKLTFDRIVMPAPKVADEFLDDVLFVAKKRTMISFYDFQEEGKFGESIKKIEDACKKNKKKYKILDIVKCGQQSPRVFRICVDFVIV